MGPEIMVSSFAALGERNAGLPEPRRDQLELSYLRETCPRIHVSSRGALLVSVVLLTLSAGCGDRVASDADAVIAFVIPAAVAIAEDSPL
jgi:hypothetical protein